MIEAVGINKSYENLHVLKGVDLRVDKGEIVSIVGKSGAGKTTLLHILGTLDRADSGSLLIQNEKVELYNSKELAAFRNKQIGFVFQFHHLLPEFSAIENVSMPALIAKRDKIEVEAKAKELLEYLGLGERILHKPNQMSGGEQQRVAIARALINNPAVVFADEPTGNLDSKTSDELHKLIFQLRKDFEQTFVIVTHNEELAKMSDRILEMEDGKIKIN